MKRQIAAMGLAGMALAGCGGGGDEPPPKAPRQVPAQALWKNFLSAERTWLARDTRPNGDIHQMATTVRPRGTAQLRISSTAPLASYDTVEVATTITHNNAPYSQSSLLYYLNPADAGLAAVVVQRTPGTSGIASTCLLPAAATQPVPAQTSLKASGTLLDSREHALTDGTTCGAIAESSVAPNYSVGWSFQADGDGNSGANGGGDGRPLFCIDHRMALPSVFRFESTCIDVRGDILGGAARLSLSSSLLGFVARNY